VLRLRLDQNDALKVGIVSIDPSRKRTAAPCSATASA